MQYKTPTGLLQIVMLLLLVFIVLKRWLLAANLLASLISHLKIHPLEESEGGVFGKLTEYTLNLSRGNEIRGCLWSRSLQRESFAPNVPVVSEDKFKQCLLYPQASNFLKILRYFYCS